MKKQFGLVVVDVTAIGAVVYEHKFAAITFYAFMIILGGVFAAIWLVLNVFLHLIIIKRVNKIAEKAEEISKGNMTVEEFEQSGKDELSSLGHSFNLMYRSLSSAVRLLDRTQT